MFCVSVCRLLCWSTRTTWWTSGSSTAAPTPTGYPTSWTSLPGLCLLLERKVGTFLLRFFFFKKRVRYLFGGVHFFLYYFLSELWFFTVYLLKNLFYSLVKSFRHKSSVLISMKYFVLVNFSPFVNPVGGPRKPNFKIPRIVSSPVPDEKITEINILILWMLEQFLLIKSVVVAA